MRNDDIFSISFHAGRRTYFFDIKNTVEGDKYLKIVESKWTDLERFERHLIMVFQEDIDKFSDAVNTAISKMKELDTSKPQKTYTLGNKREENPNAYLPWTDQEDNRLELLYCEGRSVKEISYIFGRNSEAIRFRIEKLGLVGKYG